MTEDVGAGGASGDPETGCSASIAALTLDVSNLQREVAAVRLAIEGWDHEGVDEAKEFSNIESFQVCSSGRSVGHINCRTRSVESLSSAFYGRGQDSASKRSTSAPCAAKKAFLCIVGDKFYWGDDERYTPSVFSRPHMLHRNIEQGKLPTLDVPKPSVSGICRDVKSGEQGMLGTMFSYCSHSFGGNDDDELDPEYGEFGEEYQGIFSGDKNLSFGGDMVLKNWSHLTKQKISESRLQDPKKSSRKFAAYFGSRDRPSPIWNLWTTTPVRRSRKCSIVLDGMETTSSGSLSSYCGGGLGVVEPTSWRNFSLLRSRRPNGLSIRSFT